MYGANTTSTTNILKLENEYPSFYSDEEQLLLGELWNQQQHQLQAEICHDLINWNELEYCPPSALPCNNNKMTCLEIFNDFNDICGDFGLWDSNNENLLQLVDSKPLNDKFGHDFNPYQCPCPREQEEGMRTNKGKSSSLTLDEIQKFFYVPITKAAKELNVGLTVLKKRCRELNILRWPHRKIKSLTSLIDNVKELGLKSEIAMLEEHKRMLLEVPEMELTERTKKLRQACFKANYKKRKMAHAPAPAPAPL